MASGSDAAVTISVVLPVYNVQEYLPQCLESLFQQATSGVEVVAVDDASPDDCGRILDEYARRDPRLRVVHLDRNHGLGEARNIGLGHAHGDYVWFVDSDDWVTSGALAAIRRRLERARPDVLVFDHAREIAPGRLAPNPWSRLLREPPPDESFTLDERPSALGLMMTAWNKVIRREFLLDLGLAWKVNKTTTLTTRVRNATDRIYAAETRDQVYLGAPRTLDVTLHTAF